MNYGLLAQAALEKRGNILNNAKAAARALTDAEARQVADLEDEARSAVEAGEREAEVRTLAAGAGAIARPAGSKSEVRSGVPFAKGQGFSDLAGGAVSAEEFGNMARAMAAGEVRANVEGTQPGGGVLVAKEYAATVLDQARNNTRVLQAGAQLVPMQSNELQVAKVNGTPDAGWRNEGAALATGDFTFGAVTFKAQSLAVLVKASRELVFDSGNFGEVLVTALAEAFSVKLDYAALYGSGVSPEPQGLKGRAGVIKTPIATNGGPIAWNPIVNAVQAVRTANYDPTAMILAERTEASISRIADTTGQFIPAPAYVAGLSRLTTSQVPTTLAVGTSGNTTSDLLVGDYRHLWIGLRESFGLEVLRERYADTGEIGFVCHLRADVQVSRDDAFQIVTGITNS